MRTCLRFGDGPSPAWSVGGRDTGCVQTPATAVLDAATIDYRVLTYAHDPRADTSWGAEAAELLDLDPDAVFKTLMVLADTEVIVAIVPVSGMLDLKAVARLAGTKRATMCDADRAQRVTGYVVGGISPLGQRSAQRTFADETILAFDEVFVSGGRRGLDLGVDPSDLIAVLNATCGPIAR